MIKKSKDDFGPSKGWLKVFNKIFYFFSYPFRKPIVFVVLLLLAALYAYPIYLGVDYKNVHNWYLEKAKQTNIGEVVKAYNKAPQKGIDTLVETVQNPKEVHRKTFAKAAGKTPLGRDVLTEQAVDVVAVETSASEYVPSEQPVIDNKQEAQKVVDNVIAVETKDNKKVFKIKNEGALNYLETPEEVVGQAKVFNANELLVEDKYVFLHGVYSNPLSARGVKATVFLKGLLKGESVRCVIIAYTNDDAATAECYVGDVNINNTLVENGYSDKISLQ